MNSVLNSKNIYLELLENLRKNIPCTFATVVKTDGSTPQKPGSSAILTKEGLIAGTIGGGAIEHQIRQKAAEAIQTKKSGVYSFVLNDDISAEDSMICGGGMTIFLDAAPEDHLQVFEDLAESYQNRIPGVLITTCTAGSDSGFAVRRFWITHTNLSSVAESLTDEVIQTTNELFIRSAFNDFREIIVHTSPGFEDNYTFLESIIPLPQLIIAGAGHVGKALTHLGKLLGFEVTVWDDRQDYTNKENLPDADILLSGSLDSSLGKIKAGPDTFIVIVTRGHQKDAEVLKLFIASGAGYIGMIGSRKKVAQVRDLSLKEGWATNTQWEKIHAPVGLKIHAESVQEIAVSIAAQLIQERYNLNKRNE